MLIGWPYEQFREVTGFDLASEWAGEMRELTGKGWAVADQQHFCLTREGLRFADAAAQLFLR
jgi:coproporphyrinogen III oxidase-like Fe-S oxidoreductase